MLLSNHIITFHQVANYNKGNPMIRSALMVIMGVIITAFVAGFVFIASPLFLMREITVCRVANLWARLLLFISNVRVEVIGKENVFNDRSQIFMANHQSNFDIFIVQAYIPCHFHWLAKKELFEIPVFGPAMKRAGAIEIDRENRISAIKSLGEAVQKIKEGKSVTTFPEGSRSRDDRIKPFKKGIFYLAIKSGAPIIPISIIGSRHIMPKKSLSVHPGKITMIIGKPIEAKNYSIESRDELITEVRDAIVRNYYNGMTLTEGKDRL